MRSFFLNESAATEFQGSKETSKHGIRERKKNYKRKTIRSGLE